MLDYSLGTQKALRWVQSTARGVLSPFEIWMKAAFGAKLDPFRYLGALTIHFFWIVLVSGIYLYIYYRTSIHGAYTSVAYLTRDQWYLGGVMRSIHRYASDAAVVTLSLHVVRQFAVDRYRGVRWFSWVTGVPTLWLVTILGITGYWLVWDQLAQYVAVVTAALFDQLPIFAAPIVRNFLTPASLSDRFFTLLAFLHFLSLPLMLAGIIFLHVQRMNRPRLFLPRTLAVGTLLSLIGLALLHPAHSQAPADLATAPTVLHLDWFYLAFYPLVNHLPPGLPWGLLFGATLLLAVLPWLPPAKRLPVAVVTPSRCSGCGRCADDCPYNAITIVPRATDDKSSREIALVDTDLCVSCGICAGACPSSTPFRHVTELITGIDLPDFPVDHIKTATIGRLAALAQPIRIMLFGCRHAVDVEAIALRTADVAALRLPCSAMLPPSFIEYLIRRHHADAVVMTGCEAGNCHYRLGDRWVEERIAGARVPYLRSSIPRDRVQTIWVGSGGKGHLQAELQKLRDRLRSACERTIDFSPHVSKPGGFDSWLRVSGPATTAAKSSEAELEEGGEND